MIPLKEVLISVVKFTETESSMVDARGWGKEEWEVIV